MGADAESFVFEYAFWQSRTSPERRVQDARSELAQRSLPADQPDGT